MAGAPTLTAQVTGRTADGVPTIRTQGHPLVRAGLVALTVLFLTLFIVLPVANVFTQAFGKGPAAYLQTFAVSGPEPKGVVERRKFLAKKAQVEKTWSAVRMSAGIAAIVVPLNIVFGLMAAWAVTKFRFGGRTLLVALIDLPFSVSPVVAGLVFVLLLGRNGLLGSWPVDLTWPDPTSITWEGFGVPGGPVAFTRTYQGVIFTPLATVLASIFVTFPFVARSVIPLMQAQGSDEELAARSLGAGGWRIFRTITLPNIRWALLYGVILCTARAFGEFGAVSVVSGSIDANDTMPLRIEKLWSEYDTQSAFALSSLLAMLAMVTLVVKTVIDLRSGPDAARAADPKGTP